MKQFYYYLLIFTIFASSNISFSIIDEFFKLQQSLQSLTQFIPAAPVIPPPLKPFTPHIETTYQELVDAIRNSKFDNRMAMKVAQYLMEEYQKEQTIEGKSKTQIPFIAFMVQQVAEKYPDKNLPLHCVSLDDKQSLTKESVLENEFLLLRALIHLGYKNIDLVYINPYKDKFSDDELKTKFNTWVNKNVPQPLQKNVRLLLQMEEYIYIGQVTKEVLPKNNLFSMIDSKDITGYLNVTSGQTAKSVIEALNKLLRASNRGRPNFLEFAMVGVPYIGFYLPIRNSDWFLKAVGYKEKEKILQTYTNFIRNLPDSYQTRLEEIIKEIVENENVRQIFYGMEIDLVFCDLIKYTAVNLNEPLAFRSLENGRQMTQITDMSGSLQEIYDRYKRTI